METITAVINYCRQYLQLNVRILHRAGSLKDLQEVGFGYVDWIGLAQDRDRWRTLVSAVMNLRVS